MAEKALSAREGGRGHAEHISSLRELREKINAKLPSLPLTARGREKEKPLGKARDQHAVYQREEAVKRLAGDVELCSLAVEKCLGQHRQSIEELGHAKRILKNQKALVDARLQYRLKRPEEQPTNDSFQQALEAEQRFLEEALGKLVNRIAKSTESIQPLIGLRQEILESRLTLHLDRSGNTQRILEQAQDFIESAEQSFKEVKEERQRLSDKAASAFANTNRCMKACLDMQMKERRALESELTTTSKTLQEAQKQLARMERELARFQSSPEQNAFQLSQSNFRQFASMNHRYAHLLQDVRSKIKGASYVGTEGRRLDVLFKRLDKDHSGELDEDEVRAAFRRYLKVPKSLMTDADIHALCAMLDSDNSGAISIEEMIKFITSDVDFEKLERDCQTIRAHIDAITKVKQRAHRNLQVLTLAWQVDNAVSKLNAKLTLPSLPKSSTSPENRDKVDKPREA